MGDPQNKPTGDVTVVGPYGQLGNVPAGDLGSIPPGWHVETPEEAEARAKSAKYSSIGHVLGAAGAGVARGVTLGLSDAAIAAIGGKDAKDALNDYRQFSPVSSVAGEVIGTFVGLGKAGAVMKAAKAGKSATLATRAISAPTRAYLKAGEMAERAASAIPGASRIGAPFIARSVAEGAVFGGGLAVTEAALGDSELNGELLAASLGQVGHGAAVGGALGAAMAGVGKALSLGAGAGASLLRKHVGTLEAHSIEGLAESTWHFKPAAGFGDAVVDSAAGASSLLTGIPKTSISKAVRDPHLLPYAQNKDAIVAHHSDRLAAGFSELVDTMNDVQREMKRPAKLENIAPLLEGIDAEATKQAVALHHTEVLQSLQSASGRVRVPKFHQFLDTAMAEAEQVAIPRLVRMDEAFLADTGLMLGASARFRAEMANNAVPRYGDLIEAGLDSQGARSLIEEYVAKRKIARAAWEDTKRFAQMERFKAKVLTSQQRASQRDAIAAAKEQARSVMAKARTSAREAHAAATAEAAAEAARARGLYGKSGVKQMRDTIDYLEAKALGETTPHLHRSTDDIKRLLDTAATTARGGRAGMTEQEARVYQLFADHADVFRGFLESPVTWGRAAAGVQREVNAAWSPLIDIEKQGGFFNLFMRGVTGRHGGKTWRADPELIRTFTKNITDPSRSAPVKTMTDWLNQARKVSETFSKHAALAPELRGRISRIDGLISDSLKSIQEVGNAASASNQFKALAGGNSSLLAGIIGGGVATGSPVAMAAAMASPLFNPQRALGQLGAVSNLIGRTKERLAGRVAPALRKGAFTFTRLGTVAEHLNTDKRYKANVEAVQSVAQDPQTSRASVEKSLEPISETAPKTSMGVLTTAERGAAFAASKLPPSNPLNERGVDTTPTSKKLSFLRSMDALRMGPEKLLDQIETGAIDLETVEAIREVYPAAYAQLQQTVFETVAELEAKGQVLPYDRRIQLSMAFGLPEPTRNPALVLAWLADYAKPAEQPPAHAPRAKRQGSKPGVNLQSGSELLRQEMEA